VPKLTPLSARVLINFLLFHGFVQVRQKGSHKFFRHEDGRRTTVPYHQGEELGIGIIRKILNDAELSRDQLLQWMGQE